MDEYKLIKARLPRTWSPFFARHGNFTPAQAAALPLLLAGQNVLLCAPTASGKTEAALAPLIERYLAPESQAMQLTLLYLLPTRALVNDIAGRLTAPLERLRVRLAVKTRDRDDFDPRRPASILLTTPESLDALLARRPKALTQVRGVVIDELHVFDGDVRGDQLRVLLARLRQVRTFAMQQGDASDAAVQYVALSATVAAPESAAARYFPDARVVVVPGGRSQQISLRAMAAESAEALLALLKEFQAFGWRKALVFCNTRAEVELYATAVRRMGSPFGQQVYVHYSNLDRLRRREIEEQFAQADAAICFASSTLELGGRHRHNRCGGSDRCAGQCCGFCAENWACRAAAADDPGGLFFSDPAGRSAAACAACRARTCPDSRPVSCFGRGAADFQPFVAKPDRGNTAGFVVSAL